MAVAGGWSAGGVEGGFRVLKDIYYCLLEQRLFLYTSKLLRGHPRAAEASQRCGQGGPGGGERFSRIVDTVSFVAATLLVVTSGTAGP